jgi:hypothetical protein
MQYLTTVQMRQTRLIFSPVKLYEVGGQLGPGREGGITQSLLKKVFVLINFSFYF